MEGLFSEDFERWKWMQQLIMLMNVMDDLATRVNFNPEHLRLYIYDYHNALAGLKSITTLFGPMLHFLDTFTVKYELMLENFNELMD